MFRSGHGSLSKLRFIGQSSVARAQVVRKVSTNPTSASEAPKGVFSRTFSSLFGNKQALINIFLSYFVLSLAIHNYRVKLQYEETLALKASAEKELNGFKERLDDESWLQTTVNQVQSARSPTDKVTVLKAALTSQANPDGTSEDLKPKQASNSSPLPKLI